MDSRAVQTHSHGDIHHNSHNVGSHEVVHAEEHQHHDHEKKSVLKKVKQKAKKLKDSITKHGHHDNEHHGHVNRYDDQHIPDDHDLDQEDEEPEVHGAPMYDSAAVRSATPGQVNLRKPGVNFGGTTVMGQEPHHEPQVIFVSPTTSVNQRRPVGTTRTFVEEDKPMDHHHKVNLERPMHLEEDPHAPRSTPQAYAPANYQTKVTDPTGAGGAEIDITPVEKSFSRMTVHRDPNSTPQSDVVPITAETHYPSSERHSQFAPVVPTIAETHYPSSERHSQFAPELSSTTNYPSAQSYGQYMPEHSSEVKTKYPKSHDHFTPQLSTPTKTQYPSTTIHDQHLPQQYSSATKTQYPSSGSHDHFTPQLSTPTKTQYPSTTIHDQHLPQQYSSATKTQYPSSGSHDHFALDSSVTKAQYPSSGSHDQFASELPVSTGPKIQYPHNKISDQQLPQSATQTIYPSAGSHDQFLPEFSTESKRPQTYNTATQVVEPRYESNESSYTDKISSATSAIADKAATAKNAVASKLGYGDNRNDSETTQTRLHEENRSNENPSIISSATSAIADKATTAKNAVASKLGYGGDNETTQTRQQEKNTGNEYQSTMSSAASAISDKAATAKDAVASKLGYDTNTETTQQEENTSNEKPSAISSATSAIADKAITAKNIVASKLGYGGETETTQTRLQQENTGNEKPSTISSATSAIADTAVSAKNTVASKLGFGNTDNKVTARHEEKESDHPTEYGKSVAQSLTEKLAPVYGKVAGVGTAVKSKVSGTEGDKAANVGVEQDKGVSVREYLVDKLRPDDEDRALSEVISETLHKKEEPVEGTKEGLDTSVRKLVSDAVHKREDEPERRVENPKVLGKVTESVEVKRRLGGDEESEKRCQEMYENSPGKGVVDKVKGMVGSLFTNTDSSTNDGTGVEQVNQGAGERRLQESSN